MKRRIGPWGNRIEGRDHVRPDGWAALDSFGRILEAATATPNGCEVEIHEHDMQALGRALRRVANGEDARHVFGQNKVGRKQDDAPRIQTIALLYWRTLAQLLEAGVVSEREAKLQATARAQRQFPRKKIDAATVTRYAGRWRDQTLTLLDFMHHTKQGPNPAALRAYLAKHTRRGVMD